MVALTEWAPVEVHVGECASCRKVLEALYQRKPRQEPAWGRASNRSIDELTEPRNDESPNVIEVLAPPRRSLWVILVVVAAMLGGTGLAVYVSRANLESALVTLLERVGPKARQPEATIVPPPLPSAPPAPPPPNAPPEGATPPSPSPPMSALEARSAGPRRAAASLPPRTSTPERTQPAPRGAPPARPVREPPPDSTSLVESGKVDVAVQVSVRNRKDAERDLTLLLTRVGGTKLGRAQTSTLMTTVPRASYSEFTRGLTQIGPWQLEAGRSSLPDPVHVAVTLAR